jgi:tetratricopeptide (TPR) repeat protein
MLLARPGRLVSREELRKQLWSGDTFVDFDHGLNDAIKRLRVALADSADNPRFVETVPRRGYRFIYPVEGLERRPWTRSRAWQAGLAALGLVGLLAVGWLLYLRPAQALTESDYILLTDFVNTTGDEVFDGTLKQALAVKLGESPFLNVFPERKARETLRLMEREPDERVTESIGREICERQGIKALLLGEIASLGTHYVVSLNVVNCQTGESLARGQVEAADKEEVLGALDEVISPLRKTLGESLSSIEEFDTPLEQATTSSLEALKAYTLGREQSRRGHEREAIPFFQRATELDPDFAMAYGILGTRYWNLGEMEKAAFYRTKAFELRERASESEKLSITALYYGVVTGESDKEREAYEVWKKLYPRDSTPWNNLAVTYNTTGQYDKAPREARRAMQLAPDEAYPYMNLGVAYLGLNRLTDAKAVFEESIAGKLDETLIRVLLWQIAFLEEDSASMRRHADWANGKPDESSMFEVRANGAAFFGKMQEARELRRQAVESALRHGFKEVPAALTAQGALIEAEVGNYEKASEDAEAALASSRALRVEIPAAQVLALSNKIGPAQALADDLSTRFPTDTLLHAVSLPLIRARIQSQRGNPEQAIELLRAAAPYELGSQYDLSRDITFSAIYARGRAYLQTGSGQEAVNEFQKILDHRGVDITCPLYALAHLGLARAYALAGDTAKSRAAYEDFLALWKDADLDTPILQQARAEYAKPEKAAAGVPAN